MNRRQFLATTGTASVAALAGCGGGDGGTATPAQDEIAVQVTVSEDDSYDPPVVEVGVGEAVEWVNETGKERDLRSNTEMDNSVEWELDLQVPADGSAAHTFEESGVYSYHDAEETWFLMCGAVAVGDADEGDVNNLPCE